jgi:hypothetical protein
MISAVVYWNPPYNESLLCTYSGYLKTQFEIMWLFTMRIDEKATIIRALVRILA